MMMGRMKRQDKDGRPDALAAGTASRLVLLLRLSSSPLALSYACVGSGEGGWVSLRSCVCCLAPLVVVELCVLAMCCMLVRRPPPILSPQGQSQRHHHINRLTLHQATLLPGLVSVQATIGRLKARLKEHPRLDHHSFRRRLPPLPPEAPLSQPCHNM